MESNVPMTIDINVDKLKASMQASADAVSRRLIEEYFSSGNGFDPQGEGHKAISSAIDYLIGEDAVVEKISSYISEHWETIFEQAIEKALRHKASKIAFCKVKGMKLPIKENV